MGIKNYSTDTNVFQAAQSRIVYTFDNFERITVSFSGGKDSSVMLHLVMAEAIKRKRTVAVMVIDFEAQYTATAAHVKEMLELYRDNIEPHWICLPISLRNAVSNFQPKWLCWDKSLRDDWVREYPDFEGVITDSDFYPWFVDGMEFEEFIILFADWYGQGERSANFIGIRADESLNRFRTIASEKKEMMEDRKWTTLAVDQSYNIYPIYDWKTQDIWIYHSKYPDRPHNKIYDLMHQAGIAPSQQRLCQPYGDDQKRGLWLYHILEPDTWYKVVARVNGANSGALYVQESGSVSGSRIISKPEGHTYQSFCNLLLATMPKVTREHYIEVFRKWMTGWKERGYEDGIPDEAPRVLEKKYWAPSYRRLCRVLLRNDWWCKGLGLTQPRSAAYGKYLEIKRARKANAESLKPEPELFA